MILNIWNTEGEVTGSIRVENEDTLELAKMKSMYVYFNLEAGSIDIGNFPVGTKLVRIEGVITCAGRRQSKCTR